MTTTIQPPSFEIPLLVVPPQEPLEPAFGYTDSSTTMKVVKIAEYIPIVGMFVGCAHLVYSIKKRCEDTPGTRDHILRSLGAMTNFGILMVIADIVEEFFKRPAREAREAAETAAFNGFQNNYYNLNAAAVGLNKILKIHSQKKTPCRLSTMLKNVSTYAQQVISDDKEQLDAIQDPQMRATIAAYRKEALYLRDQVIALTAANQLQRSSCLSAVRHPVQRRTLRTPFRPKRTSPQASNKGQRVRQPLVLNAFDQNK
jgi:hypothetical protein